MVKLEYSVQDFGEREKNNMKKIQTINYTDEPILIGEQVPNFLPKPEDIVLKKPEKHVTLQMDTKSINFFKRKAQRMNTTYTHIIRTILETYVSRNSDKI